MVFHHSILHFLTLFLNSLYFSDFCLQGLRRFLPIVIKVDFRSLADRSINVWFYGPEVYSTQLNGKQVI